MGNNPQAETINNRETMVSCIMPTYNRRAFVPHAIRYFLRQDYPQKELIIIDDGTDNISDLVPTIENIRYYRLEKKITLGAKLNLACKYAKGDIIANWDDDDWYAERRLSYQVSAIQQTGTAVCGINRLLYYDLKNRQGYQYIYPPTQRVWLLGSSLCFTRQLWETNTFADINVGMDGLFVWATPPERVRVLEDNGFSVHMIHEKNISPKNTSAGYWHKYPVEDLQQIMDDDWQYYINDSFHNDYKSNAQQITMAPVVLEAKFKLLKNIFVCLVHENENCILDLIRNMHFHDPASTILLYNGSSNSGLLPEDFPYEKYNVIICPDPKPQQHGYLHRFALDCMEYALENIPFDVFTIVDSDQLCIRSGYTEYISRFFMGMPDIGMLSSMPDRVLRGNTNNLVAAQAFKEFELWKPFLNDFPDGENKFVYWTFWPSTVFAYAAIRDLLDLFSESRQLQEIMQQTKIWATEEVIFPTLIKLMGYEIVANPCSYDYVKYRKNYTTDDVNHAINSSTAFWMHPVARSYDDPVRSYARRRFNDYLVKENMPVASEKLNRNNSSDSLLIKKIRLINGWLNDNEAALLINFTRKAFATLTGIINIVETGSYHGKSTVLFGTIMKDYSTEGRVYAIDTHDGKLGAVDQGLITYPPSLDYFKKNIANAEMEGVVKIIRDKTHDITWDKPVAVLFIDGLHDYNNAATDFNLFADWVVPGGFVAFHDYADYFPGVKQIVNEVLAAGDFIKIQQVDSLIILQKQ